MLKKPWFWVILIMVIAGLGWFLAVYSGTSVDVTVIAQGNMEQYVEETATVKSTGSQVVYCEIPGRIAKVYCDCGNPVRAGDLLLSMDETGLKLAEVVCQQAKITYGAAFRDYQSAQNLYEMGLISNAAFNTAEDNLNNTRAGLRSAELELNRHNKGVLLRSPVDGVILEKAVKENEVVAAGAPAFTIGGLKDLEIEAEILAEDAVKIQLGNPVEIRGKTTGGRVLSGTVVKVAPMAKTVVSSLGVNQKRLPVTVRIAGENGLLKPGYNVDLKIITTSRADAIMAPIGSVFEFQGKDYVFVVKDGKAQLRKIVKGFENNDFIEILDGLRSGEMVIAKPENSFKPGMKVKVNQTRD